MVLCYVLLTLQGPHLVFFGGGGVRGEKKDESHSNRFGILEF